MEGRIIVIVAPSGTGKSTLIKDLQVDIPALEWSVSYTTRPIREGEVNGVDYHYISPVEFEEKIAQDDFVEWAKVHSNYYGTSKTFIDQGLRSGKIMLFDLDVQGVDAMKKIYGDKARVIFIEPPSIDTLRERLEKRGTETQKVIDERVQNAQYELTRRNDYDYLVTNDDIQVAYENLKKIILEIINA